MKTILLLLLLSCVAYGQQTLTYKLEYCPHCNQIINHYNVNATSSQAYDTKSKVEKRASAKEASKRAVEKTYKDTDSSTVIPYSDSNVLGSITKTITDKEQERYFESLDVQGKLISLWDEWVKQCYDDSTLGKCVTECVPGCPLFHPTYNCWKHKDPNNLKQFMEFIKKRQ